MARLSEKNLMPATPSPLSSNISTKDVMTQVAHELNVTNDLMSKHAQDLSQGIGLLTRLITQQLTLASAQDEQHQTTDPDNKLPAYDAKESGRQAMQALQSLMMAMQFEDLMAQRLSQLALILDATAHESNTLCPKTITLKELRDSFAFLLEDNQHYPS